MTKLDKKILGKLREKQFEVSFIPPQEMGPLTYLYKNLIGFVKVAPWRVILLISILLVLLLRAFFGSSFVKLANILQAGF